MCGINSRHGYSKLKISLLVLVWVCLLLLAMPLLIAEETPTEKLSIEDYLTLLENNNSEILDSSQSMSQPIVNLNSNLLSLDNRVTNIDGTLMSWSESLQSLEKLEDNFKSTWLKQDSISIMLTGISKRYSENNKELKDSQEITNDYLEDFDKRLNLESEKTSALGQIMSEVNDTLDKIIVGFVIYMVWDLARMIVPIIINAVEFVE